jgi:hypothetical protein
VASNQEQKQSNSLEKEVSGSRIELERGVWWARQFIAMIKTCARMRTTILINNWSQYIFICCDHSFWLTP